MFLFAVMLYIHSRWHQGRSIDAASRVCMPAKPIKRNHAHRSCVRNYANDKSSKQNRQLS